MSLLEGMESFVPAFKGRELAIESGKSAASSYTQGVNSGSGRMNAQANQSETGLKNQMYLDTKADNEAMLNAFNSFQ